MRTLLIGGLIFLAWLLFCRWHYVCQIHNLCSDKTVQVQDDGRAKTLDFLDNGKTILEGYDQFDFASGTANPNLNANNRDYLAEVAKHLKAHPDRNITIMGNYLESERQLDEDGKEKAYGFFENLGVARADAIRKLLVEAGIPEERIRLDYNLVKDAEGTAFQPISVKGYASGLADGGNSQTDGNDTDKKPEDYGNEGQQFSFTNMSFSDANFAYNSAKFNPGNAFVSYADSVVTYLTQEKEKSLVLVGHTCDKGSDDYNLQLGKKRAESVKQYFQNKGVKASITTKSDGESKPAYPNTSEASRSKNRRVVVQIK